MVQAGTARRRVSPETRRVLLLVVCHLLLAGGVWVLFVAGSDAPMRHPQLSWWLLAPAFALAELCFFDVVVRREQQSVSLSEIPLVLGLFFAAPTDLLVARLLSVAALILVRKQTPLKAVYNFGLLALETSVALAVFHVVLGGDAGTLAEPGVPLQAWLAMYAAVATAALLTAVSVTVVMSVYQGRPRLRDLQLLVLSAPPMAAIVGTIALTGVYCLGVDVLSAIPLAVTLAVLLGGYRIYSQLRHRYLSLERIYQFSQAVTRTPEIDDVLRNVLNQALEMLRADTVSVLFDSGDGSHVCVTINKSNRLERVDEEFDLTDLVWTRVLAGTPVLLPRNAVPQPEDRAWLEVWKLREALIVPLHGETGVIGALMVGDRDRSVHPYDEGDVALLESVGNHATVALQNGRLVDQLRHAAMHDSLTELPNRLMLQRRLLEAFRSADAAASGRAGPAVLVVDLNGFKNVNDTLGHQSGDLLLQEVAMRMRATLPDEVLVARLGGDEFAVLLPSCETTDELSYCGELILSAFDRPISINDIDVEVGASIGGAMSPADGCDGATLLKHADTAMYVAKDDGGGVRLYDRELETTQPRRQGLVEALRLAIANDELVLEMQPQMCLGAGVAMTAEAVVRWDHPTLGRIEPTEFLPLAERSGLIRPLTLWVLRAALRHCAHWRASRYDVGVALDISHRNLHHPAFAAEVREELAASGVPAAALTLELSEQALMSEPVRALPRLRDLSAVGVRLCVDRFGAACSSVAALNQVPVDEVKIDRMFVLEIGRNADAATVVRSLTQLGTNLGLDVVADGVEDVSAAQVLAEMGCRRVQGGFVSLPMTPDEFMAWLAGNPSTARDGLPAAGVVQA